MAGWTPIRKDETETAINVTIIYFVAGAEFKAFYSLIHEL